MQRYFRLGRVHGIEIGLHYSWFFIFALLTFGLATDYFPGRVPGGATSSYWLFGALSAIMLFISVLLHELCHSLVAKHFKLKVHGISLFFFGGISQIPDEDVQPKVEVLLAGAGPVFSLFFAMVCGYVNTLISADLLSAALTYLAYINVLLGVFNFMPAFPLDGGRILRAVLLWKTGDIRLSTYLATRSGKFFGAVLVILGFYGLFSGYPGLLWFILLGGFLYLMADASYAQVVMRTALSDVLVKEVMVKPKALHPDDNLASVIRTRVLHDLHEAYPVMEDKKFLGFVRRSSMQKVRPHVRKSTKLKKLVRKAKLRAKPSDKAYALLTQMVRYNVPLVPVYKNKKLKGVLRREDIIEMVKMGQ